MTLQNLEAKWSDHLAGQNCPPVLGLASLSEDESEVIRQLVADEVSQRTRPRWQTLLLLLRSNTGSNQ